MLSKAMKCVFVLLLLGWMAAAQPPCAQTVARHAGEAKKIQAELLAVKLRDEMDVDVTPATQKLIRKLKDSLASASDAYMGCAKSASAEPVAMERPLAAATGANQKSQSVQPQTAGNAVLLDGIYGNALEVHVKHLEGHPALRAVEWTFGIPCSFDSVLLVYQHEGAGWRQVIRWQSKDYEEISGAYGDFLQYAAVPLGKGWALAAAHGTPWCTSRMSLFALDVMTFRSAQGAQKTAFHKERGYSRGDIVPVMKPRADGFDLRLEVNMKDTTVLVRKGVYRYSTADGTVRRVQPVAMNGRDFVDEWLQVPWSEAGEWSAPEHAAALQQWHDNFERREKSEKDYPSVEYGAVRACGDSPMHFQAEVQIDQKPAYFQLLQGTNSFTMQQMTQQPAAACKSADLMRKSK